MVQNDLLNQEVFSLQQFQTQNQKLKQELEQRKQQVEQIQTEFGDQKQIWEEEIERLKQNGAMFRVERLETLLGAKDEEIQRLEGEARKVEHLVAQNQQLLQMIEKLSGEKKLLKRQLKAGGK